MTPLMSNSASSDYAHRFGGPNDEVIMGHPLHGNGLQAYRAHEVANSQWLRARACKFTYRPRKIPANQRIGSRSTSTSL